MTGRELKLLLGQLTDHEVRHDVVCLNRFWQLCVVPGSMGQRVEDDQWRIYSCLQQGGFVCGVFLTWSSFRHSRNSAIVAGWTPELESLWAPFVTSSRPLIVSIEDPLFVELRSNPGIYYRDRSLNHWEDLQDAPALKEIGKALKNPEIQPSRYYTAFGEASASFLLGRLLGSHAQVFSLSRASQLSWQQLADNNVIFIGVQNLFFDQIQGLPIEPQLIAELGGVRNPHPASGEPGFFADQYSTAPTEQGVVYALVTHLPGPLGKQ